jgi:glycosyltransferase 2 family protein
VVAIVIVSIVWTVSREWRDFKTAQFTGHPDWGYVLASGAVVLTTYALLVEVWRRILGEWHARISFANAARIWCVSSLGRYVPGKVWQILAMGKMAEAVEVPPAAAAGSAILSTVVQIAMGCVVAVAAGWRALDTITQGHATLGILLAVMLIGGVLLLPVMLPSLIAVAERLTRRSFQLGELPRRAVYVAIVGNIIAWVMYGWSFQLLVHGVLGSANGTLAQYTATYAVSYIIGYLVFLIPGGVGPREAALIAALSAMRLATLKEAAVIAVTSRLWLTVLEIFPGLIYLARRGNSPRRTQTSTPRDGTNL